MLQSVSRIFPGLFLDFQSIFGDLMELNRIYLDFSLHKKIILKIII
jgi:hypothetical protein